MTPELAQSVLKDKQPGLRELAVTKLPIELVDLRTIATSDHSPAVQAAALRRISDKSALPILFEQ